jgi:hypothetical protein
MFFRILELVPEIVK